MDKAGVFSWERFSIACMRKGESPSHVMEACGTDRGAVTRWKKGAKPSNALLAKVSEHLDVDADYLLCKQDEMRKKSPDDEMYELAELAKRPEVRVLMHIASGATKEDIESMIVAYQYRKTLGE